MKKFIVLTALLFGCFGVYFIGQSWMSNRAQNTLLSSLNDAGFTNVTIEDTDVSFGKATFHNIEFGEEGFGHIEHVKQNVNFLSSDAKTTDIAKITINALPEDFSIFHVPQWLQNMQQSFLNLNEVNLNLLQLNIASDIGDLRIESKLSAQTADNGDKSIQAVAWARQYQLSFELPLSGIIQQNGDYLFESHFNDGKFKTGPLRLSRMNGWMSLHGEKELLKTISMQFDTGSAELLNLPLQNISAAYSQSKETANGLLRANITGLPKTTLAVDYNKTAQGEQGGLFIDLPTPKDTKQFWNRVLDKSDISEALFSRLNDTALSLSLTYQPERRFPAGPVPFSIVLKDTSKETHRTILQGNLLIYMDTLQIKGSVFGDNDVISDVKTLFKITDDENESKDTLRFDVSMAPYLKQVFLDDRNAPTAN